VNARVFDPRARAEHRRNHGQGHVGT
jgi:hypothetical protein